MSSVCIFIVNFEQNSHLVLVFLLLNLNRARFIGVFLLLAFSFSLNRYFCFSLEKSNYFYRNRLSYPFFFSLLKERSFCIAHNTDHPLLCSTFHLTLSLPVTRCAGHNTDLPSNSNISKTVRVNIALVGTFARKYSLCFLMISRLTDFSTVVL